MKQTIKSQIIALNGQHPDWNAWELAAAANCPRKTVRRIICMEKLKVPAVDPVQQKIGEKAAQSRRLSQATVNDRHDRVVPITLHELEWMK